MLKSLYIQSFVIIDKVSIDFDDHMSVLTGETGAGKSIIVDALGQLCGNRSSASSVRKGENKAIIEGVFSLTDNEKIANVLSELGMDVDDEIIITKEISSQGKSTIKMNYRPLTNAALKMLAPYLLHIHSQFETQSLFSLKNHIVLLDEYIGKDILPLKEQYLHSYKEMKSIEKEIRRIEEEEFSDEQIEYYEKQYNEIKDFSYTEESLQELENEADILKNYEQLHTHVHAIDQLLSSSDGAFEKIDTALHELDEIKDMDEYEEDYNTLYNLYYSLMDVHSHIIDTFGRYEFDEYRFNEVQEELYEISRLKNKYGYSLDDIYEARDTLKQKIDTAKNRDDVLMKLKQSLKSAKKKVEEDAIHLQNMRQQAAKQFEKDIKKELDDLYLPHAAFKVHFEKAAYTKDGGYDVIFMIRMNTGQSFAPLNESASGGELSRLMLAIKTITLKHSSLDTIIFDEVDTGVSGKVADAIGSKMEQLAQEKQVICITHLPQVAVHASHHFSILKQDKDGQTYSNTKLLDEEERINEIATMLSGDHITKEALDNARTLLKR